ncbi:Integrin beta-like protein 1 [Sparganum proliferum]
MLTIVYRDERPKIYIVRRTDSQLLNNLHILVSTRLFRTTVHDLLFADDCTLNTDTKAYMQRSMEPFISVCANFELTINTDEVVVMHSSSSNAAYSDLHIHLNGIRLKTVDDLAYLGSSSSRYIKIENELPKPTKPLAGLRNLYDFTMVPS